MTDLGQKLSELRLAVMFLTRLPVGQIPDPVPNLTDAKWAFPWVGIVTGAITWAVFAGLMALGSTPMMAAIFALAALVLITGGLHQDGLADFADGMGGGRDKDHCLEIMRDSRIGTYGVLALIIASAIWINGLHEVGPDAGLAAFLAIAILSRAAMLLLLIWMPPAREDGLGASVSEASPWSLLSAGAAIVVAVICLGSSAVPVFFAAALASVFVGYIAMRRIGGHTGDVLGACQFLSASLAWAALALFA